MLAYILAAALAVWLGLGVLAIFACAAGGRAEAAWREAQRRRAEPESQQQPQQKPQRRSAKHRARCAAASGPMSAAPAPAPACCRAQRTAVPDSPASWPRPPGRASARAAGSIGPPGASPQPSAHAVAISAGPPRTAPATKAVPGAPKPAQWALSRCRARECLRRCAATRRAE